MTLTEGSKYDRKRVRFVPQSTLPRGENDEEAIDGVSACCGCWRLACVGHLTSVWANVGISAVCS